MQTSIYCVLGLLATMTHMSPATTTTTEGDTVEVQLSQGKIQGLALPADNSKFYYSFRGIPYAQPPVGKLRFKDPLPGSGWSGIRGTFSPAPCPQVELSKLLANQTEVVGEEDCLYLHVYTPRPYESKLPVMVFIHGGGFFFGDADTYGGSAMPLMTKDVVLVSIQYRLGTLGFLSTEDSVLAGNLGLKDQTLALGWVQDNIHHLGGDPNRVTIFGESAGAASVHYQIMTPRAQGLFQRAIMQSGNALCPWAYKHSHRETAAMIGRSVGCPGVDQTGVIDSQALLACLMDADYRKITAIAIEYATELQQSPMVPRADGDYLPSHPARLLREGRYNKVDIMAGVNREECSLDVKTLTSDPTKILTVGNMTTTKHSLINLDDIELLEELRTRIMYKYLGPWNKIITGDPQMIEALQQMLSDLNFVVPHDITALFHTQDESYGHHVYMYQLNHRGRSSVTDFINTQVGNDWISHIDELQYLFTDVWGLDPLQREDDFILRDIMLNLWTNFAATGNPTPDLSLGFRWWPASPTNLHHLSLTPAATMHHHTRTKIREFLTNLPTMQNKMLFPENFGNKGSSDVAQTSSCTNSCASVSCPYP